jgi:hypothetical protein
MSAIGFCQFLFSLVTQLLFVTPGDVTFKRKLAEAQTAHVELAHVGARPSAQLAAVAVANLVFQGLRFFGDLCSRSH